MMASPPTWAGIALALLPLSAELAEDASVADLQKRLEEQEQRTRVMERKPEIQVENAQAALRGKPGPSVSVQSGISTRTSRRTLATSSRRFDGEAAGGADVDDEKALLTRFQLSF